MSTPETTVGRPARRRRAEPQADSRAGLARLGPIAQVRAGRLRRRLPQLIVGLILYGSSLAMLLRSTLGNAPWDVLHQGMARHLPISIGQAAVAASFFVLLAWVPLREVPGLGTIGNAILVGLSTDIFLGAVDPPDDLTVRILFLVGGIVLNALATAVYIGAQFGSGPRDGLMTGLSRRTGRSLRLVRTLLELFVVTVGWFLGGVVGVGTVLYALLIGPLSQRLLPAFIVELPPPSSPDDR